MLSPELLTVPVTALRPNPWNTNRVSADHEKRLRASIERNGIFKPIIVRQVDGVEGYEIIGGEHRFEQAVELGYTEVPICNLGKISDVKAKEIGVIDNTRYGADDTLSFSELLKEIGDAVDLQEFLPYAQADLDAIFSASVIALDKLGDLEVDNNFDAPPEEAEEKPTRAPKTHTVMRFKISLGDAERITALIAQTQKANGFTTADDLTNAGDALVHLLTPLMALMPARPASAPAGYVDPANLDAILDEALSEK